jgi:hypothetical protein
MKHLNRYYDNVFKVLIVYISKILLLLSIALSKGSENLIHQVKLFLGPKPEVAPKDLVNLILNRSPSDNFDIGQLVRVCNTETTLDSLNPASYLLPQVE